VEDWNWETIFYGHHRSIFNHCDIIYRDRTHQTRVGECLSPCAELLSGVVQGSGIGPVLFLIYIDDLAKLLERNGFTAKLFADDVKVYLEVVENADVAKLQGALDLVASWASQWQLQISVSKCSVLTVGRSSIDASYSINGFSLPRGTQCRDLGVTITSDLSSSQHVNEITTKAHKRANCILRCFASRDANLLVRAFIVYVRPILEYNSIIWSPYLKKEVSQIEKVQRRFTKRLRGLSNVGYTERLSRLGLPTLELRRLQLDLIFCYKIVFGLTSLTSSDYFQFSSNRNTRGHAYKLYISQNSCNIRRKFLPCRILTVWNSLPANTDFSSLAAFRRTVFSSDLAKFLQCTQ